MGLLDQAKDFATSSEGKKLFGQAKEHLGNGERSERGLEQGYGSSETNQRTDDYGDARKNDSDYNSSTRQSQSATYGDSGRLDSSDESNFASGTREGLGNRDRDNEGYGNRQNQSAQVDEGFGAREGVSRGGVGDTYGGSSVSSGGYGANTQGDSFSSMNQSGFDNERMKDSSARDY
ncbi:hypothetical protein CROQUDRAFT_661470 [Cronartium quercuum f. sp. fusiforme G11]|uniref:Uncharacterized protein n=1 Tax=Cronartium quercuum f. sp. fusiforme G11 TaxID=708437 RepID=A0A9P6NC78_9BASI|nr:hypothetical protein CROQUDRAFT_661470 [Cronartium quercuum f. sp. fusiforme G11]